MRAGFRALTFAFAVVLLVPLSSALAVGVGQGFAVAEPATRTCPAVAGTGALCLDRTELASMAGLTALALCLAFGALVGTRRALGIARSASFAGGALALLASFDAGPLRAPLLTLAVFLLGAAAAATLARPQPRNAPSDVSAA